jgi:hypothetical protein
MKLPFAFICVLLFGLSGARALKLCEEIVIGSCPGGNWYPSCYTESSTYECSWHYPEGFGYGPYGTVRDCGCGGGVKIEWRCSSSSSVAMGMSGPYCWCQLRNGNAGTVIGPWVFKFYFHDEHTCYDRCAHDCAQAVAEDQVFLTALCTPAC